MKWKRHRVLSDTSFVPFVIRCGAQGEMRSTAQQERKKFTSAAETLVNLLGLQALHALIRQRLRNCNPLNTRDFSAIRCGERREMRSATQWLRLWQTGESSGAACPNQAMSEKLYPLTPVLFCDQVWCTWRDAEYSSAAETLATLLSPQAPHVLIRLCQGDGNGMRYAL